MEEKLQQFSQRTPLMPMLAYDNATEAIKWYRNAFAAEETARLTSPDGKVGYAEIKFGKAVVSMSDVWPGYNHTPQSLGGSTVVLNLYVDDVDEFCARAVAAGAKQVLPVQDQFYGDRSGRLEDPFGHVWIIATHQEDVSFDEMQKRFDAMCDEN